MTAYARRDLGFRRPISPKLVCDKDPRLTPTTQLAKEPLGPRLVAAGLHKNIHDITTARQSQCFTPVIRVITDRFSTAIDFSPRNAPAW